MFSYCLNYKSCYYIENTYLSIEEVTIAFEFIAESLVWGVQEFSLIADSLLESFIDLILDIMIVILGLFLLVFFEERLHFLFKSHFLLIKIHNDIVVVLLLIIVDSF